jgi:hypothetical protein
MGSAKDINTTKPEFREAWKALKAGTPPDQLAAAYLDQVAATMILAIDPRTPEERISPNVTFCWLVVMIATRTTTLTLRPVEYSRCSRAGSAPLSAPS